MDSQHKHIDTVRYLLSKSLDGSATADEMRQLDLLVVDDPQARRYYVEFLHVHVSLRKLLQKEMISIHDQKNDILDVALWEALARHEQMAETVVVEPEETVAPLICHFEKTKAVGGRQRKFSKFSMFSVAASAAAALFVVLYIHLVSPSKPIVATLTDSIHAEWVNPKQAPVTGDEVRAEMYWLRSGIVSLTFESGAEVVIEGPAEYQLLSVNEMSLQSGKAFAHVPATAIGFTIDTPQSSVVDLGTDFGVAVTPVQGSDVYVYHGKVNLVAGLAAQPKRSEILHQFEARTVDAERGGIKSTLFKEYLFAQKISSKDNRIVYGRPVSLASFVAGGDGFSPGNQPAGIDPGSGEVHQTVKQDFDRTGSPGYHAVPMRDFVDGVFVPNGVCVVDSAGHRFTGFPSTSGSYWSDITTSPVLNHIATNDAGEVLYRQQLVATLDTANEDNDAAGDPSTILLHANSGITFDLNKIRGVFKEAQIVTFSARCGVSKNAIVKMKHDFWVLLDGQPVYHYHQPADNDTVETIRIPIGPEQSYLTLATTDGGDNTSFDWCLFENAVLELIPAGLQ